MSPQPGVFINNQVSIADLAFGISCSLLSQKMNPLMTGAAFRPGSGLLSKFLLDPVLNFKKFPR